MSTSTTGLNASATTRHAAADHHRRSTSPAAASAKSPPMIRFVCPFWALPIAAGIAKTVASVKSGVSFTPPPLATRQSASTPHAYTPIDTTRQSGSPTDAGSSANGVNSTAACGR
jgi:hypothetical protein